MLVGATGKQDGAQLGVYIVEGIRQILCDFLFYRTAFLIPIHLGIVDFAHPQGFDIQSDIEILGGNRIEILGEAFPCVGIEASTQCAANICQLIRRKARASPKHHMLLGVGRAGKSGRRFIRSSQIVDGGGDHRRQPVTADDDDAEPI